ncbi:MAG: methyltransferase domain-containing protein [Stenotrophobium sp.]
MNRAQAWRSDDYARHGGFVPALGATLLQWLAPQAGERVLDLGCGDGVLTQRIVDAGCAVVGADASAELAAAARARGLDVRVMDGQQLVFGNEFDAVFSNAALHWMKHDPDAVIAGVHRALRAQGRFVAEMGGQGNVAQIREALHAALRKRGLDAAGADPWYFPSADEYGERLRRNGFRVERIETYARPTPLPTDVRGWLVTFAQSFLARVSPDQQNALLDEATENLRPLLCDAAGLWTADYVRLRFIAYKTN